MRYNCEKEDSKTLSKLLRITELEFVELELKPSAWHQGPYYDHTILFTSTLLGCHKQE